jgi:hypothetical protein
VEETRTGDVFEVGQNTIRSPHPNLIFKKPPPRAEIAGEWMGPLGGRRLRAVYGRDPDGSWRGTVEDVGHTNDSSGFALIRILDDAQVGLPAVQEMTAEMDEKYLLSLIDDKRQFEDENLVRALANHLEQVLDRKRMERRTRRAGMAALGIRR